MAGIGSRPRGCGQESLRSTCGWGLPLTPKAPGFAECSLYNCYSANTCSKWSGFRFSAHSGILALACFFSSWFLQLRRLEEKNHRAGLFLGHLWEVPLLAINLLVSPGHSWLVATSLFSTSDILFSLSATSVCLTVRAIGFGARAFLPLSPYLRILKFNCLLRLPVLI